jgi:hypothetical protein
MIPHPTDQFCCNITGRKLHDALIQKPAIYQKFNIGKDLRLAWFGGSLAVDQEFRGGSGSGCGRKCSKQAGESGGPFNGLTDNHEGLRGSLRTWT